MASDERIVSDKDLRRIMGRQPDAPAQTEALLDELEQGLGLLSTLAPNIEMDGLQPLKMARAIHASIESNIDALSARISNLELSNANLRDTIALGTMTRMSAPFKERLTEAWRVFRGVVDIATMRRGYYDQAARADREMKAHSATMQRVEEERKAIGAELHRLRDERQRATDVANKACDQRDRALVDADRHAREHINRADALNKVIEQFMADCRIELRMRYERHMPPGNRFQPVTTYPKGTMLERRDSANRLIAVSHDGGETWASVETVVRVADVPRETPSNAHVNQSADSTLSPTPAASPVAVTTPEAGTTAGAQ